MKKHVTVFAQVPSLQAALDLVCRKNKLPVGLRLCSSTDGAGREHSPFQLTDYNRQTYPAVALLEIVLPRSVFLQAFPPEDQEEPEANVSEGFQYSFDVVLTAEQAELLNRHVHQVKLLVLPRQ
ncbi:MAG: hypothetical protein K2W82_11350 [Candidatus Obscuribacterales bacterium]|nr:hypothetical protein [Candidatus Obscuribacterales bacterium]